MDLIPLPLSQRARVLQQRAAPHISRLVRTLRAARAGTVALARQRPVPAVMGALLIGFVMGRVAR
ncbi:MAG: hypothetical protein AB2A00_26945 [Myxococcota bacterium]